MIDPSFAFTPSEKDLTGIQLYTVRDDIKKDPMGTLIKISQVGYNNIEAYDFNGKFFDLQPGYFRQIIEGLGMRLTSTHTEINIENADKYIEQAHPSGLEYLVIPSAGGRPLETADDCKRFAEEMNLIGEKCADAGMRLGYHNHNREFKKDVNSILYDVLLEYTDPELVIFQLDIYWIIEAGYDPVQYFRKYPGRFELWHVKDRAASGETTFLGNGTINFREIFNQAESSGLKYFYIEQEQYVETPLEDIQKSFAFLKKNILKP